MHRASLAYRAHTWPVQILIGTKNGLVRLHGDGHLEWLLKGEVGAIDGRWAIVDGATMVAINDPTTAISVDPHPSCLATGPSGLFVGTVGARLFEVRAG